VEDTQDSPTQRYPWHRGTSLACGR
jgi:hypothetical protein